MKTADSYPSMPRQVLQAFQLIGRKGRQEAAGLAALTLVVSVLEALGVGLILPIIQIVTDPSVIETKPALARFFAHSGLSSPHDFLILLVGGTACLVLLRILLSAALLYWQFKFVYTHEAAVGRKLFETYLRMPYVQVIRRSSADYINAVQKAVFTVFSNVILAAILLATELCVVAAIAGVLLFAAPTLTAGVFSIIAVISVAVYSVLHRKYAAIGKQAFELNKRNLHHLQQSFYSLKEIVSMGRAGFFIDAYRQVRNELNDNYLKFAVLGQAPRFLLEGVVTMALFLTLLIMLLEGRNMASMVELLALFAAAILRLMPSASKIMFQLARIRSSGAELKAVYTDYTTLAQASIADAGRHAARPDVAFERDLSLDHVSFSFPGTGKKVLDDISLTIRRGESVGIVGSSGAGKTTLVDLIIGLIEPDAGAVRADGVDIRSYGDAWVRQIGYVPQTVHALDDSLRRNIVFGVEEQVEDEERLRRVLRQARLDTVVEQLPNGLETRLGENGVRLSGGQRQRVGIARALYHGPQILVLDEATSALDNETEREVAEAIDALAGQQTLVIIAHRLSTVRHCDRLVLMNAGRIADSGTFDELIARNGEMRRLVELGEIRPLAAS